MRRKNDLKKFLTLIIIFSAITLCSCSGRKNDTFFVHAAGFENDNNGIKLTAILEKLSDDKENFFTAERSSSSINKAADKLSKEYSDCYFATSDLYFIPSSISNDTLTKIAENICDSNIFPTTSSIFCIKDSDFTGFLNQVKNNNYLRQLKKKKRENTVSFFASFYSGNDVSLDTYSLKNGSLTKTGTTTFNKSKKAVFNED